MVNKHLNLKKGDLIKVGGSSYMLEQRLGGGFQFRTWLVKDQNAKTYVAKLTDKTTLAEQESSIYKLLRQKGLPKRYYPEPIIFAKNNNIKVIRQGRIVGNLNGLIIKYYPYQTLQEFLASNPSKKECERVATKLDRRIKKLHEVGVVHKDLRENNILVRRTRKGYIGVRIVDFGSSNLNASEEEKRREDKKLKRLLAKIKHTPI